VRFETRIDASKCACCWGSAGEAYSAPLTSYSWLWEKNFEGGRGTGGKERKGREREKEGEGEQNWGDVCFVCFRGIDAPEVIYHLIVIT